MILDLQREPTTPRGCTFGRLSINGIYQCDTLEDAIRAVKIPGQTCIPAGVYLVRLTFSTRFQCILPILDAVPNFTSVRIHSGNVIDDTEGCILVGSQRFGASLGYSRKALRALLTQLQSAPDAIRMRVENPPHGS